MAESGDAEANKAKLALQKILEPTGLVVEIALTEDHPFNNAYTMAIKNKKVADQ